MIYDILISMIAYFQV